MLAEFRDHDLLAMPTVPVVAPPVEDFAAYLMRLARNAIPWSFVGFPAVTVPCGWVDGLPVGLQLVAAPDARTCSSRSVSWSRGCRPPLAVRARPAPGPCMMAR